MTPAIVHRYTIPMREAMASLLADQQVDAETYEVRVINDCLVIDMVSPALPFGECSDPPQTREVVDRQEMDELVDAGEAVEIAEDGGPPSVPRRFFYQPDTDMLITTDAGSQPDRTVDEAGWIEVDAQEGEEIAAEHAKQGDLLGSGDGDGKQEVQEQPPAQEERKGGKLAQRAGIICGEKAFWRFMDAGSAEEAAENLRLQCGVTSRADFDHDKKAGREFEKLDASYRDWLTRGD